MKHRSDLTGPTLPPTLLRRAWKASRRWRKRVAAHLGLAPKPANRGYVICASARSGSTYFTWLLTSTGFLGYPREYFNFATMRRQDPRYPRDPRKQLRRILSSGATANGLYGLKIFPWQLGRVRKKIDLFRDFPNPAFVRLVRKDVLGQAISQARASQTSQFSTLEPELQAPKYDERQIRHHLAVTMREAEFWDRLLASHGIRPLTLEYEAMMRDPQHVVDQVARLMGIPHPVPISAEPSPFKVQRDEISAEWRRRFLSETGDEFRHLA